MTFALIRASIKTRSAATKQPLRHPPLILPGPRPPLALNQPPFVAAAAFRLDHFLMLASGSPVLVSVLFLIPATGSGCVCFFFFISVCLSSYALHAALRPRPAIHLLRFSFRHSSKIVSKFKGKKRRGLRANLVAHLLRHDDFCSWTWTWTRRPKKKADNTFFIGFLLWPGHQKERKQE